MKKFIILIFFFMSSFIFAVDLKNQHYDIDREDGNFIEINDTQLFYNENKTDDFKIYYDEFGYKKIIFSEKEYTIIDGFYNYILFDSNVRFWELRKTPDGKDWFIPDADLNGKNISNVTASSELKDKYYKYSSAGILSAWAVGDIWWCWVKNNIPWVEGEQGNGIGEFIEFDVKHSETKGKMVLSLLNGYVNLEKPNLFKENNRIKTAEIQCDYKDTFDINFNDVVEFTEIEFPKRYSHIKIIIKDVYGGTKYQDTSLTAVSVKDL